jgi:hypothetical protein
VTPDSSETPHDVTANPNGTGEPNHLPLAAEERETVLIWNDADRTWSVYSDSARKGRVARWLRALGIEPTRSPEGGIEAEGIPEWAVSFRARKRRRRPGLGFPTRNPSEPQKPPIQRYPDRVEGSGGLGTVGRTAILTALGYRRAQIYKLAFLVSGPEATGLDS